MLPGAFQADPNTVRYRYPLGVVSSTFEAFLQYKKHYYCIDKRRLNQRALLLEKMFDHLFYLMTPLCDKGNIWGIPLTATNTYVILVVGLQIAQNPTCPWAGHLRSVPIYRNTFPMQKNPSTNLRSPENTFAKLLLRVRTSELTILFSFVFTVSSGD